MPAKIQDTLKNALAVVNDARDAMTDARDALVEVIRSLEESDPPAAADHIDIANNILAAHAARLGCGRE